jgi:hypothetical protein
VTFDTPVKHILKSTNPKTNKSTISIHSIPLPRRGTKKPPSRQIISGFDRKRLQFATLCPSAEPFYPTNSTYKMHLEHRIGLVQKALLAVALLALYLPLFAQPAGGIADTRRPLSAVPMEMMPAQDNQALLTEELARRGPGIAPKFAVTMDVDISPATHGIWETLPNGLSVWRLRLASRGAHSINLGFTEYRMPQGASMILYSPDKKRTMGPFTPAENSGTTPI